MTPVTGQKEGAMDTRSKFRRILDEAPILDQDRNAVDLYANYLLNTWQGCLPSQAAERAVNEYVQNPSRIRTRQSGEAPC